MTTTSPIILWTPYSLSWAANNTTTSRTSWEHYIHSLSWGAYITRTSHGQFISSTEQLTSQSISGTLYSLFRAAMESNPSPELVREQLHLLHITKIWASSRKYEFIAWDDLAVLWCTLWCHCTLVSTVLSLLYGVTVLWCHCIMMSLHCGVTALWCHCTVVSLHYGVTALVCHCTVVSLHYGVTSLWCHCTVVSLRCDVTSRWCHCTVVSLHSGITSLRCHCVNNMWLI